MFCYCLLVLVVVRFVSLFVDTSYPSVSFVVVCCWLFMRWRCLLFVGCCCVLVLSG